MRSRSGTKRTEIDGLCRLIEAGRESGAKKIQWGDFCVEFGVKESDNSSVHPASAVVQQEVQRIHQEVVADLAAEVEDARIEQLLIEDPVEFDRRMLAGELEKAGA